MPSPIPGGLKRIGTRLFLQIDGSGDLPVGNPGKPEAGSGTAPTGLRRSFERKRRRRVHHHDHHPARLRSIQQSRQSRGRDVPNRKQPVAMKFALLLCAAPLWAAPCQPVEGASILARDVARVVPAFAKADPSIALARAPIAGVQRIVTEPEMAVWARKLNIDPSAARVEVCFERAAAPLTAEDLLGAVLGSRPRKQSRNRRRRKDPRAKRKIEPHARRTLDHQGLCGWEHHL